MPLSRRRSCTSVHDRSVSHTTHLITSRARTVVGRGVVFLEKPLHDLVNVLWLRVARAQVDGLLVDVAKRHGSGLACGADQRLATNCKVRGVGGGWLTCRMFRHFRMSPPESRRMASTASGVTLMLENRHSRQLRDCPLRGGSRVYPSEVITCCRRGRTISFCRGAKRKRVQRDCRAGMILLM